MWSEQLGTSATHSQAPVRLESAQPECFRSHLVPGMVVTRVLPSHLKMTRATIPKMATTVQPGGRGDTVSSLLVTHAAPRQLQAQELPPPSPLWGSTGFCSQEKTGFVAGRTTEGQGWMDPCSPFCPSILHMGEMRSRDRGRLSQMVQQDWNPGHWAPSLGSPALGSVLHCGTQMAPWHQAFLGVNRTRNPTHS